MPYNCYKGTVEMKISQEEIKKKPTKKDYMETKEILRDFCIYTAIPKFSTLSELYRFRKNLIAKKMNEPLSIGDFENMPL